MADINTTIETNDVNVTVESNDINATTNFVDLIRNHNDLRKLDYASAGHTGFEPAKGTDDYFVTNAEKTSIPNIAINTSSINTNTTNINNNDIDISNNEKISDDFTDLLIGQVDFNDVNYSLDFNNTPFNLSF